MNKIEIIEGLSMLSFFNQRAGRELWNDKPKEVQNKDIEKAEEILQSAISELKRENNQKPIKQTKYIDGNLLFSKIAGHSDYHGDNILSAISCLQEGKEISTISTIGDNE